MWLASRPSICLPRSQPRSASCSIHSYCTLSRLTYACTTIMNTLHTVNRSTPRLVSIAAFTCVFASQSRSQGPSVHETSPIAELLLEKGKADSEFVRFMPLQSNRSLHPMTIIRLSPMLRAMMEAPPFSCRSFKPPLPICSPAKQAKKNCGPKRLLPRSGRSFIKIHRRLQSSGLLVSTSETPRLSRGSHCRQKAQLPAEQQILS